VGAEDGRAEKASLGEFVVLVESTDAYRLWAESYDDDPNPVLALAHRVIRERLHPLFGHTLLDIATGTGYWAAYGQAQGATVFGVDRSLEMLSRASSKQCLRERLVCADMRHLPFGNNTVDVAVCSFAVGYVESVAELFQEMARVSRSIIVTDLHPTAVEAGWQRGFRAGDQRYLIRQFTHSPAELDQAARTAGLQLTWRSESYISEPERPIFVRAGREQAFEAATRVPAILSSCWERPC
jgi:ubiquinone/menaquinone biosynthesis C-methylase UbiE